MTLTLSEFLDAAGGLLTEDQKNQLITSLLDTQVKQVKPGDLITANVFNQMLADIVDLAVRVSALEGNVGGPEVPVIFSISPNPVTVGSDMTISGDNLDARYLTTIQIGDSRIATGLLKIGSNAKQLIFSTPGVTGATPAGIPVQVIVANDAGTATSACVVRSGVAADLAATIGAVITKAPAAALAKNTDYEFDLDLTIESSHAETFSVTPLLAVNPAAGWTLAVTDGGQASVQPTAGVPVTRKVVVKLHTGDTGSGTFSLQFAGTSFPSYHRSSVAFPIAIGSTTDQTDGPIQIKSVAIAGDQTQKTFKNGEILITSNLLQTGTQSARTIRLTVELAIEPSGANAIYDISLATDPPPDQGQPHWTVVLTSPPAATPQIQQPPGGAAVSLTATILASGADAPDVKLVVGVAGQGALPKMTQKLGLRVIEGMTIP